MAYNDFTPDYSKYTDYSSSYPVDSVVIPANAPVLGEDLNEIQEIQNNKLKKLNAALYTDGYIHTGTNPLYQNDRINVDGYVLFSGTFYRVKTSTPVTFYRNTYVYLNFASSVITAESEITSAEGEKLPNYLADNLFKAEVSRRKAHSVSISIRSGSYSSSTSMLLMQFTGETLVYVAPDPTFKGYAKTETVTDMRPGKTFLRYESMYEPTHHDKGVFYYAKTDSNSKLCRSTDLVDWQECDISSIGDFYKFDVKNGYMFVMDTSRNIHVSENGKDWKKILSGNSSLIDFAAIPIGDNKANAFCTRCNSLSNTWCEVAYKSEATDEWTYFRISNTQSTFSIIPTYVGSYCVTPANDICILINGDASLMGTMELGETVLIAFTCDSEKLIYNKAIMIAMNSNADPNFGVASNYSGCENPDRCIWYAFPGEKVAHIWCIEKEGSTDTYYEENGSFTKYTDAYEFSMNCGDNPQIYVCDDIYAVLTNGQLYFCKVSDTCNFTSETALVSTNISNRIAIKPTYSQYYENVIFAILSSGSSALDTVYIANNDDGNLSFNSAADGEKGGNFTFDKYGRLYYAWKTNYKAQTMYNAKMLLSDCTWGETRSFAVDADSDPVLNYVDHSIYLFNNGEVYISGKISEVN